MNVNVIKKVGTIVFTTAVSTLTSCTVRDLYNKYAKEYVTGVDFKGKFNKLNPFSKN